MLRIEHHIQMLQPNIRDSALLLSSTLILLLCLRPTPGWGQRVINAPSPSENVEFGWSIASAGDVNGDGTDDLIVGDPNIDATFDGAAYNEAGKAYVYSGGSGGTRLFTLKSPNEGSSNFGFAVGSVGDVNGDGTPDLVVGAPQQDPNGDGVAEGQAYLFNGTDGTLLRQLRPSPGTGMDSERRFGRSVDAIGDVNGDGTPDVLVGARKQGYLISGASGTPILETFGSLQSGITFTGTIEAMGDVNGNGVSDVAIEATGGTRTQNNDLVKAYVYDGDSGAKIRTLATSETGGSGTTAVGLDNLEDIGDVNGDGVPDLAVGSPFDTILATFDAGRVFLFSGANGDELQVIDAPDPNSSKTYFGLSLARTADYDGDGLRDLLVGAPFQLDQSDTDKIGRAYIISTDPNRSNPVIDDFLSPKPTPDGAFGYSAAAVGDVNGDGVPDVALSATGEPSGSGGNDAGRVYQFSGSTLSAVKTSTKSINGNGSQSFGNTGVSINFSGTGGASGSATVKKFAGRPLGAGNIPKANVSTYSFTITSSFSVGTGTKVRFDVSTLGGIPNPDNNNVQIYKRDEGETTFNSVSTTYNDSKGELVAEVSGFSEFVFASNNNELPVELASMEAHTRNGQVVVSWRTASETNNAGFQIQHRKARAPGAHRGSSTDAWESRGFVEGHGTTDRPQNYRFVAEGLPVGTQEFRLKQVDLDGTTTVHDPVTVDLQMQEALRLGAPAPNPVQDRATLSFAVNERAETTITLYNTLGQRVRTVYRGTPPAGEAQTVRLSTTDLTSGVYFVRLQAGAQTETRRVTVVR